MDKLELCIQQHGQAARTYVERGIIVGDVCLLPELGFSSALLEALDRLFKSYLVNGYPRICDVKIFAKPRGYRGFDKELIGPRTIASLWEFCAYLYPQNLIAKLDEYWDEADIYNRAEELHRVSDLFIPDKGDVRLSRLSRRR